MNEFLELNPEFEQNYTIIKMIENKVIFKDIQPLNTYLGILKLPLFKILLYNDFYKSKDLKRTYEEIIKNEAKEVESMIFQLICKRKIYFKDIKLKFLFYKEFPDLKDLFLNDRSTLIFEIQDLIFKKVYLHESVDSKIEHLILKAPFKLQIFLILALKNHINHTFIKDTLFDIKDNQRKTTNELKIEDSVFIKNWSLGLRALSEKEFYAIVTSEIVYSSLVEKILLLKAVEEKINHEKLSICILKECQNSTKPAVKMYVVFLKIIEILRLNSNFKLKLLYSWLRYFSYNNNIDLFIDLLDNIKNKRKTDEEFEFYLGIEKYLKDEIKIEDLLELSKNVNNSSQFSSITVDQLIEKYKTKK